VRFKINYYQQSRLLGCVNMQFVNITEVPKKKKPSDRIFRVNRSHTSVPVSQETV